MVGITQQMQPTTLIIWTKPIRRSAHGRRPLKAPKGQAPKFILVAARDPDGANLDRAQIVKGWLNSEGVLQEKVYDVAWSGDRSKDLETGKVPAVGSTVDVESATYKNTIGAPELAVVWTDPDFDASERAFYYARVLEIPRPRWTTVDAMYFGIDLPSDVPHSIQDRAYTSPFGTRLNDPIVG